MAFATGKPNRRVSDRNPLKLSLTSMKKLTKKCGSEIQSPISSPRVSPRASFSLAATATNVSISSPILSPRHVPDVAWRSPNTSPRKGGGGGGEESITALMACEMKPESSPRRKFSSKRPTTSNGDDRVIGNSRSKSSGNVGTSVGTAAAATNIILQRKISASSLVDFAAAPIAFSGGGSNSPTQDNNALIRSLNALKKIQEAEDRAAAADAAFNQATVVTTEEDNSSSTSNTSDPPPPFLSRPNGSIPLPQMIKPKRIRESQVMTASRNRAAVKILAGSPDNPLYHDPYDDFDCDMKRRSQNESSSEEGEDDESGNLDIDERIAHHEEMIQRMKEEGSMVKAAMNMDEQENTTTTSSGSSTTRSYPIDIPVEVVVAEVIQTVTNTQRPPLSISPQSEANYAMQNKIDALRTRLKNSTKSLDVAPIREFSVPNPDAYTTYSDGVLNYRLPEYNKDGHETQVCFVCDRMVIYKNILRFIASSERRENWLNKKQCTIYREVNLCHSCSTSLGVCCISHDDHLSTLLSERGLSFFMPLTMILKVLPTTK